MSWPIKALSEVCYVQMGSAPKGETYVELDKGIPLIAGAADYGEVFPSPKKATTSPTKLCQKGDLIICVRATIGDLNWADKEYCLGRGVAGLRSKEELLPEYLFYFIKASERELYKNATGSTFLQINRAVIEQIEIPLPPLPIQKQIAAVLEKADRLRQQSQQMEQELNSLAQSVFLDMFGDPLVNEKNFPLFTLNELSEKITDGKHGDCEDEADSGYFFASAKNVRNGTLVFDQSRQINKKEFEEVHKRTNAEPGDIVMVNTGATIGRVSLMPDDPRTYRTTFQKSVAIIKLKKQLILPELLKAIFELRVKDFAAKGSGSAIKNLLLSTMKEFPIIVPPMEQQILFKKFLDSTNLTKVVSEAKLAEGEKLFESLMQRAFKGELDLKDVA